MFSRQIDMSYANNYDLLSSAALTKTSLTTLRYWKVICDNLLDSPLSEPGPSHDCALAKVGPQVWVICGPGVLTGQGCFPKAPFLTLVLWLAEALGKVGTVFLMLWAPLGHPIRIFTISPVGLPRPSRSGFYRADSLSWILGAKMAFSS